MKPKRVLEALMLAVAAVFLVLHGVHLRADFPNYSQWMDWAKYTDEGWYGDAAIRHFNQGHWYVLGDFNPAVALPVWPALEAVVFRFTGVTVTAARGLTVFVFALTLVVVYFLMRRFPAVGAGKRPLAPALAVLLLATSSFCFVFERLAILEPLLILLGLVSVLVASYLLPSAGARSAEDSVRAAGAPMEKATPVGRSWYAPSWPQVLLGVLLPVMVLTKTTAIFLLPAILYPVWLAAGLRWRRFAAVCAPTALIACVLWGAYFFGFVRPHYLVDYKYLFSANQYTNVDQSPVWQLVRDTLVDGMWMDRMLYPMALMFFAAAVTVERRLWRNPLFATIALWIGGYFFFLAWHNNLQPRYYLVIAVPMTMLAAQAADFVWQRRPVTAALLAPLFAVAIVFNAVQTVGFVRRPEYSLVNAAAEIKKVVDAEPNHSRLVLSISGSELSLMNGVPSICDDFGTIELADRVKKYKPGWFVTWNYVEDDKMDALNALYTLERVAAWPVMDDPDRNLLIIYRLVPRDAPGSGRKLRKRRRLLQM